jgi:pyrroline-5-carboxylate reductase
MNISFIGFGNMAKAMAQCLVKNQTYHLRAASPSLPIGVTLEGVETHYDNLSILADADIIILAVKPAKMAAVLTQINDHLPPTCLMISVAAGRKLDWIENHIKKNAPIIRAMPNIAAEIAQSATPLIANFFVTDEQKIIANALFSNLGITTWVEQETDMDAYTALSGSGCAYVFLFMEALVEGACAIGLSEEIATSFALQTVLGAANVSKTTKKRFSDLRANVTSPAGTTAAALAILHDLKFKEIIKTAMGAAYERSQHLSQ